MNSTLGRIGGLFRHRWDPHVITALEAGPLRYRALSVSLAGQTGEHCDDSTLTRALQRLIRGGFIAADTRPIAGRDINIYQLTAHGRDQVAAYRAFRDVYEQLTTTAGHHTSGVWPHQPQSA